MQQDGQHDEQAGYDPAGDGQAEQSFRAPQDFRFGVRAIRPGQFHVPQGLQVHIVAGRLPFREAISQDLAIDHAGNLAQETLREREGDTIDGNNGDDKMGC